MNSILAKSVVMVVITVDIYCFALVDCLFVMVRNLIRRNFREFVFKNLILIMVSSLTVSCEGLILLSFNANAVVRVVY
jgi:hypothetical protein